MKEITIIRRTSPITVKIQVDDADFELVSKIRLKASVRKYGYVQILESFTQRPLGNILLGYREGLIVDHKDRNSLNFQRDNLRHVTQRFNTINRRQNENNPYGFKGICEVRPGRFRATLKVDGVIHAKGGFRTAEAAARFYDFLVRNFSPMSDAPTNKSLGLIS